MLGIEPEFTGNNSYWGDFLKQKENLYQIGSATYVVERIFSDNKTVQDVVIEEIITTAKQDINISHSKKKVI